MNLESKLYTQYLPMKLLNILFANTSNCAISSPAPRPSAFWIPDTYSYIPSNEYPVIHNAVRLPIPLARNRDAKNTLPSDIFSVHILCSTILAPPCHASPPRCVFSQISSCRRPPLNIKPRSRPSQRPHFLPCQRRLDLSNVY